MKIAGKKQGLSVPERDEERSYPTYTPTKAESAAILRGRAAYKRGDYVTLTQLRNDLEPAGSVGKIGEEDCEPPMNADERRSDR
jgi:hypothetical protein